MRLFNFILVFLLAGFISAQNLVPNYSFESYSTCPTTWSQLAYCTNWMDWRTTPDYFNACNTGTMSTPNNGRGSQVPSDGVAYVSITTYVPSNPNYREILGVQLSSPLVIGTTYNLSMKVSVSDNYGWASDIGMQFFNSSYTTASPAPLNNTFHLVSAAPITDKTNWIVISGTYTATAAYTYLGLGNFNDDGNTNFVSLGSGTGAAHYYIDEVVVEPINSNPVITAQDTTICEGGTANLTATSTIPGTTYLWSTGGTTSTISVSPTSTTTYTVTGTDPSSGLTGTTSVTVTVNPLPNVSASANPASICEGESTTLSASGADTYSWSNGSTGTPVNVSPSASTTYYVTGTSAAGCSNTASVSVTVNPIPVVSASANPTSVCPGNNSDLTASGASTYVWSTSATGSPITVNPATTTTYSVTGTDANGCSNTADVTVTVLPGPVVTTTDDTICEGETATLTASGATNYTWDNSMTGSSITVSPSATTTYTVSGTDGSGCTGVATATVTVNSNPIITIISTPDTCNANVGTATASPTGGLAPYFYEWNTTPPQTSNPAINLAANTYTVTVTDDNGCFGTADVTLGNETGFTLASSSTDEHCDQMDGTADVIVTGATNPLTYIWSHDPGLNSPGATGLSAGVYTVTVNDGTCQDIISITVYELAGPIAGFMVTPSQADIENALFSVTDLSIGATSWLYDFCDGFTSTLQNPTHTYTSEGTHTITQYVYDDYGCSDSLSLSVSVEGLFAFYIPNAFSPNGDNRNDYFLPKGIGINADTWHMRIYDRWGRTVFVSTDINQPWDGEYFLEDVDKTPTAVFGYYISFKTESGLLKEYYGHVTTIP
ncbi:MAG: hypothetical protein C0592_11070 [Marinilabiliales bacterium]|mgnify:CR=1 FL=1|nr:MAG: hypothetical protein C0592_11070 [Marinilabiliales bacterium]